MRSHWLAFLLVACTSAAGAADVDKAAQAIAERANAFRKSQELGTLKTDPALEKAAAQFARFMARTGKYGHTADGRQPSERARAAGYDYCIVRENIGYVYRSTGYETEALVADLMEGWKESREHRESLLAPAVTETGVGVAQGEGGRYFAVQLFGRSKAAAIRFTVKNDAGRPIEYRTGEHEFSLPPRALRRHTVCRPPQLRIALPGKPEPFTARPGDGARFTVSQGAGGFAVTGP